MAANSSIEWTDATWNCLAGCEAVSPGCALCYAATMTRRLEAMGQADYSGLTTAKHFNGIVRTLPHKLDIPLRRRKPTRYFVNSMSDLFHESVPDEFIDRVFAVMNATTHRLPIPADLNAKPWHTYQVLTKRPERMFRYIESRSKWRDSDTNPIFKSGRSKDGVLRGHGLEIMNAGACLQWPIPNVWLGVSCEDQQRADERIPWLLKTRAAVRFLSCEPLLGPIDLSYYFPPTTKADCPPEQLPFHNAHFALHWVIVGGESGHGARPCNTEWISQIVAQCGAAGVPCFVKQMGSNAQCPTADRERWLDDGRALELHTIGDTTLLKLSKKGGDIDEWPDDFRVREFPQGEVANA